jgi:CRP/FNR family cyclic AMP-dependent transcriptional regulator
LRLARHGAEVGGEVILTPAPTHEALGAKIAAAREAVTRHLLELEREDLIRIGRKSITIIDIARLRRVDEVAAGRNLAADGRDDD